MIDDVSADEETGKKEKNRKTGSKNGKSQGQLDDSSSVKIKGDLFAILLPSYHDMCKGLKTFGLLADIIPML